MIALVSGAAGFIGSNLTDKLLELGCSVVGVDNLINGNLKNLENASKNQNFEFKKGDICDSKFLDQISSYNFDIIFHQAAMVSVSRSVENPTITNLNNVDGTLKLLEFARKNDIDRFVYASSSSVYGDSPTIPKQISMQTKPISPYGVSKLAAESYTYAFYRTYGLKTVSLRYFNVYGPRQAINEYSGVITIFFDRVVNNKPPIIFGDGKQTRDFTYIDDVVQANLLAAEARSVEGKVFNVGMGKQTSILDLAHKIIKIANKDNLIPVFSDPRPGDIRHSLADISETKKYLNFEPKIDIETGLQLYYKWFISKNSDK